ncbi:hypothetical protein G6F40_017567 [Rhizopus arrhizus]|nr:hypothetical protein G6F40_017567 [Rhizopus arrhizus]
MGDEQCLRHVPVVRLERGQAFTAAIDGQPRTAIALDHRHRRPQLDRRRIADAKETQRPVQQVPRFQAMSSARRSRA